MKKILFALSFIAAGLLGSPASAQTTLDSLITQAIKVSPKIKMLQAKLNASEDMVPQVSNLPDPMLTLGLMNLPTNSFSFTQEAMTGKIIGLSQKIPFPGKLSTMGKVSRKNTDIVKQELIDAENEIKKNVASAYYELSFVRKAIELENESSKLLKSIADVVRTKYSVSAASQQNLLKVELEITKVNDKLDELTDKQSSQLAIINSYLLRPSDFPVNVNENYKFNFLSLTQGKLDSLAKANRPFLKGIKIAEEKAALQISLADYDYYPNFNIGVQYTQRDRIAKTNTDLHDLVSFMVGISLPLNYGGKVSAKVEETQSMEELYKQQFNSSLQMLNGNFGTAVSKLNTLKKRIELIDNGLLPQAEQTLKAALSSYQVGKIDFINVIDAENTLYKIQTSIYRLKTNYLKEVASLEFLTGSKL
jgi:outer membrane protein, heavy metal efflux system